MKRYHIPNFNEMWIGFWLFLGLPPPPVAKSDPPLGIALCTTGRLASKSSIANVARVYSGSSLDFNARAV